MNERAVKPEPDGRAHCPAIAPLSEDLPHRVHPTQLDPDPGTSATDAELAFLLKTEGLS